MICQGNLQVAPETPLSIISRNHSLRNTPTPSFARSSIRKRKSPYNKQVQQVSCKNKRALQSLLGKYQILSSTLGKLGSEEATRIGEIIGRKICMYEQVLHRASHRLPTSPFEEECLAESPYNMKLGNEMEKDLQELKQYGHKFNCSLHRKNKYYECIDDIRRKINSMGVQGQAKEKSPLPTPQVGRKQSKQILIPPLELSLPRRKGKQYLNFSREVGVESKERYFKQRGRIKFVREVVHHWWANYPPLSSSLS